MDASCPNLLISARTRCKHAEHWEIFERELACLKLYSFQDQQQLRGFLEFFDILLCQSCRRSQESPSLAVNYVKDLEWCPKPGKLADFLQHFPRQL